MRPTAATVASAALVSAALVAANPQPAPTNIKNDELVEALSLQGKFMAGERAAETVVAEAPNVRQVDAVPTTLLVATRSKNPKGWPKCPPTTPWDGYGTNPADYCDLAVEVSQEELNLIARNDPRNQAPQNKKGCPFL
ncbi:MAG: hypothetical protein M1834_009027 [Cirrosporium novae-zelandiae]|nr:MAG: hypothetical protein M1834_009027 [Cirrosporium novae-zelandiae]